MPKELVHKDKKPAFNIWLNDLRNTELNPSKYRFSFSDLDGVFIADRVSELLWFQLEVKTRGKRAVDSRSQNSIISLLKAVGEATDGTNVTLSLWEKESERCLAWLGFHILTLSGTTPDDSNWMLWDGEPINRESLISVLRFENDPRKHQEKLLRIDKLEKYRPPAEIADKWDQLRGLSND